MQLITSNIFLGHHNRDLEQYADLFFANNINGKRLLLLDQVSLQAMDIASFGHRIDLHVSNFMDLICYKTRMSC